MSDVHGSRLVQSSGWQNALRSEPSSRTPSCTFLHLPNASHLFVNSPLHTSWNTDSSRDQNQNRWILDFAATVDSPVDPFSPVKQDTILELVKAPTHLFVNGTFTSPNAAGSSREHAKPRKLCKCGSDTHQRTSHHDCPLNKKNFENLDTYCCKRPDVSIRAMHNALEGVRTGPAEPVVGNESLGVTVRAVHPLNSECMLVIAQGSVVDFEGSAIVNAANTGGLGGVGVDGAICRAGGAELAKAREALPILDSDDSSTDMIGRASNDRIRVGSAVTTIGGALKAEWCIHAVGPMYSAQGNWPEEDALLRAAYTKAVEEAAAKGCTTVGFSLLSAGIFRGRRELEAVLRIGCEAVRDAVQPPLRGIYLVGFTDKELNTLLAVADAVVAVQLTEATTT